MADPGTFTCANCGRVLPKTAPEEEVRAEYEANMPSAVGRGDEEDLVCTPCYAAILRWAKREGITL